VIKEMGRWRQHWRSAPDVGWGNFLSAYSGWL
jgi:hypothetical protein